MGGGRIKRGAVRPSARSCPGIKALLPLRRYLVPEKALVTLYSGVRHREAAVGFLTRGAPFWLTLRSARQLQKPAPCSLMLVIAQYFPLHIKKTLQPFDSAAKRGNPANHREASREEMKAGPEAGRPPQARSFSVLREKRVGVVPIHGERLHFPVLRQQTDGVLPVFPGHPADGLAFGVLRVQKGQ